MNNVIKLFFFPLIFLFLSQDLQGQPIPCGDNPDMTSFCEDACVVCDIDGFSGVNNLTAQGQGFDEFCTTQYNNMQYIAFIAGSVDLTIRVDVGSCSGGANSLEVGFFQTDDCENFTAISFCDTDIFGGNSTTFTNNFPLVVGQHYYLVIDGSNGANCDWTFNVLAGSTQVPPLSTSGVISGPTVVCSGEPATFSTTGQVGASAYEWSFNGMPQQTTSSLTTELTFPADGIYELCVIGSNACSDAPQSCTTILARTPGITNLNERICDGDCVEVNGVQYCATGIYQERIEVIPGCDSIINLDLTVVPVATTDLAVTICNGTFFQVGDSLYTTTGNFQTTVLTVDECDSIIFLDLLAIECEIIATAEEIPVVCKGTATGTLIFSVNQGEAPLTYTYTNIANSAITGTGMTNLLTNNEVPGIPAGTYQIYVSDNFGNDAVVLQDVSEPPTLVVDLIPSLFGVYNVSCFETMGMPGNDGSLLAIPSGGVPPYNYFWSTGDSTNSLDQLSPQNYQVSITDNVGCLLEANFTMVPPPPLMADVDFRDPTCDGFESGQVEVLSTVGGTPDYSYALNDQNFQPSLIFNNLPEGVYELQIMDANGCVLVEQSEIFAPAIPVVEVLEDITIDLGDEGILAPLVNISDFLNITWTDSTNLSCWDCLETFASPVNDEIFYLNLTSLDDCSTEAQVKVTVNKNRPVYIPNVFSPNGDGVNDEFTIFSKNIIQNIDQLTIYHRWGGQIFKQTDFLPNDLSVGWDGKINGKNAQPGVYIYIARVTFIDGVTRDYRGDVAVMR